MFYVSFARAERRWILADRVSVAMILFNICESELSMLNLCEAVRVLRYVTVVLKDAWATMGVH